MKTTFVVLLCVAYALAGCAEAPWRTNIGSTRALMTPADARIITERGRPSWKSPIICSEPSPDIAKAISVLAKASGGSGTVSAGGGISTSQSISVLAGRTAGVVALRDGLFKACEAYANGVISSRSYSLILSNYGDILVTLMLSEDAAGIGSPWSNPKPTVAQDFNMQSGGSATVNGSADGKAGSKGGGSTPSAATPSAGTGAQGDNSSLAEGPALAAAAVSFADDANAPAAPVAPAAQAAKVPDPKTPDPKALPEGSAGGPPKGDEDSSTGPAPKAALSAPEAINNIAKLFLMDSAANRHMGALVTLCMSGTTPANLGRELDSAAYIEFCEMRFAPLLAEGLQAQAGLMKAQGELAKAQAGLAKSTAAKLDADTAKEKKEAASPLAGQPPAGTPPNGGKRGKGKRVVKPIVAKGPPSK